jgi:prepilin-type N-terminal cleavage/methylation domain-containing protein
MSPIAVRNLIEFRQKQRGVTLLELALCMMILAVLSVGVSALMRTGVEAKMAQRNDLNMQSIGMNFSEDLRTDIRTADSASISNNGNTMTLSTAVGNVVYSLNNGQLSRQPVGQTAEIYNDPTIYSKPVLVVSCQNACFTPLQMNSDSVPSPREILVNEMKITQSTSQNTIIDRNFGLANFALRAFSFNLTGATEFQ